MVFGSCLGQGGTGLLLLSDGRGCAGFEAEAVVAGLQDVAAVSEAVEERGGHLGVAEDGGPFAEAEVGRENDAGASRYASASRAGAWNGVPASA